MLRAGLIVAALVIVVDRLTKIAAERGLDAAAPRSVIEGFFDLRLAYNRGAAFSFLADAGG